MFDWFWTFLYQISKTLFKLIDGLIQCANYLCGIEPVKVDGKEVDFLQYILTSGEIGFAFRVVALLGIIVVVVFAIIAILRTLAKEKAEGTPAQIVGRAIKSILSFLFIPTIMIVLINAGNVFMEAMYKATIPIQQEDASLGDFLFKAFAMESGVAREEIDEFLASEILSWHNTSDVWGLMDLSEFEFIFSWIAGGVIFGCIGVSMMYFVNRVISITILYIVAPFSIGASVLDEGARFKLWREQILIKFLTGYGMMISINIFAMICLLVMNPTLVFSGNSFIDFLIKLLLIAGGGTSLKQVMALIGNLISSGAGSNELRDAAISGGLTGLAGKIPGMGLLGGIGSSMKQEITGKAAQKILPSWAQRAYGNASKGGAGGGKDDKGAGNSDSDSQNSNSPIASNLKNTAKEAILGGGNDTKQNDNQKGLGNTNDKEPNKNKGNALVNNIINNSSKPGDYDDLYDA